MNTGRDAELSIVLTEHDVMNAAPSGILTSRPEVAMHQ
jgi:hypothetical protein